MPFGERQDRNLRESLRVPAINEGEHKFILFRGPGRSRYRNTPGTWRVELNVGNRGSGRDYTTASPKDLEKLKRLYQERLDAVHCAGQVLRDEGFTERFRRKTRR